MEGLGLEEGGGEGGVLPVVQSVLQHLLSREVLYPSLKEITDKVRGGRGGSPRRCHSTPSGRGGTGRRWGAAWERKPPPAMPVFSSLASPWDGR